MTQYKKQFFYVLVAGACIFGAYFAYVTVDRYQVVVSGVLGIAVLYFLYLVFLSPKRIIKTSNSIQFEFPFVLQYLLLGFAATLVMVWASIQILHLVWYVLY